MEKLVSVIIPVYNAEKYLKACVESVQRQSYHNIEIILVDDGSIDQSGAICDFFMQQDSRIHVIHKTNGGLTSARRAGLKIASGEYIIFVDADDLVIESMVNELKGEIERTKADLVVSDVTQRQPYGDFERKNMFPSGTYERSPELINNILWFKNTNQQGVLPFLVGKIFQYDFICRGFETIHDSVQFSEDLALTFWAVLNAERISFINKSYYIYIKHEGSITTSPDPYFLVKVTEWYLYMKSLIEKEEENAHLLKQLDKIIVRYAIQGINRKIGLSENDLIRQYYLEEQQLMESKQIVLYGAGAVGRDFYKQLAKSSKVNVSVWIDRNFEKYEAENLPVQPLNTISSVEYDYVLIAALREDLAENMKENLKKMAVPDEKIIWVKPQILF